MVRKRLQFVFAGLIAFVFPDSISNVVAAQPGATPYFYTVANSSAEAQYIPVITRQRRRYLTKHRYVSRPRYVVRRRSRAKSAAIIGGSAAAGAGIGALAGGGKGAGIGALAGGAAGLIYDRKTHKKVVRQY